ncbi:MAG: secretin N-terminal domain-containing protein, partial [Planctomycetota bacterium]
SMGAGFTHLVPRERLFDTYRAILAFYELNMIPIGPKGYEIYLVVDSRSTNNFVKNKAVYVDPAELEKYADKDGMYVSCAIQVQHIDNLTTLRTALSTMVSPAGLGRVHEVPGSRSIIIMDFAPTVAAMARLIKQMDVKPVGMEPVLETIELKYANAELLAETIMNLLGAAKEAEPPVRRGQRSPYSYPKPAPRVVGYEPRNAVLISASKDDFARIKQLVATLDQPAKQWAATEVVRLGNVRAKEVADSLCAALDDGDPVVVADLTTNSIILAGQAGRIATVRLCIEFFDRNGAVLY